jgi:hypothetical protein
MPERVNLGLWRRRLIRRYLGWCATRNNVAPGRARLVRPGALAGLEMLSRQKTIDGLPSSSLPSSPPAALSPLLFSIRSVHQPLFSTSIQVGLPVCLQCCSPPVQLHNDAFFSHSPHSQAYLPSSTCFIFSLASPSLLRLSCSALRCRPGSNFIRI